MISALELKNKLEKYDKETSLLDFNIHLGFLPALSIFPLLLTLGNPQTILTIIKSPVLFGFGFAGVFALCLGLSTIGLLATYHALGRYIATKEAVRRFNVNGMLEDNLLIHAMAKGLDLILFNRIWMRFMLLIDWIFEEIKQGLRYDIDQSKKEILEKVEEENRTRNENERFYINNNIGLRRENAELKNEVKNLRSELEITKQDVAELKRKESEREQKISKKAHANNNDENTKSLDDSNKIEFLDE